MFSERAMDLWIEMVGKYCNCYPDENGNMPCDNGRLCDECYADKDLEKAWLEELKKRGIK